MHYCIGFYYQKIFSLASLFTPAINSIEKCLKLCLDLVNSIIIFYRHLHSVFILARTFKCLYLALLQDDVDFFPRYYLEVVIIMRSWLSMGWLSKMYINCYFQSFPGCSKTCSCTRKHLNLLCRELQYIFMKLRFAC